MVHQNSNNQMGVINSDLLVFLILVFPGCPARAVGGLEGAIWVFLCELCGLDHLWSLECVECGDLDLLNLCLSLWLWQDVDLVWCLMLEWWFLCHAGVPDGGILSEQSAATWSYSSQSKHFIWGQWHAMCPDSWHWKHMSSSLDMMFTVDEGSSTAVNCCAAWSFSTSLMASAKLCDSFS